MIHRNPLAALALWLGLVAGCEDDPRAPSPSMAGAGGACEPMTCADQGIDCGELDDGCGQMLQCGSECQGGQGGTGGASCEAVEPTSTPARTARRAVSTGFSGTSDDYSELYTVACETTDDCVQACEERGGGHGNGRRRGRRRLQHHAGSGKLLRSRGSALRRGLGARLLQRLEH